MPDLDLIKQEEQGRDTGAGGFRKAGRESCRPAAATKSTVPPGCCWPVRARR